MRALHLLFALLLASAACERPSPSTPQADLATASPDAPADLSAATVESPEAPVEPPQAPAVRRLDQGSAEQLVLLTRARRFVLEGDLDSAEAIFEELITSKPTTSAVLAGTLALAALHLNHNRNAQAIALCDQLAARDDAAFAELHWMLSKTYIDAGDDPRAIAALRRALELEPDWFFLWAELAARLDLQPDQAQAAQEAWERYDEQFAFQSGRLTTKIAFEAERALIAERLRFVEDERAVAPLIAALEDEDPTVRERAAESLGELAGLKDEAALKAIKRVIARDSEEAVRTAARASLKLMNQALSDSPQPPAPSP
jgi:tetratricopeptide (TPR) repeat protein